MIAKKILKPIKTSTRKKKPRNSLFDYGYDSMFREYPISLEGIDRLAAELFEWALNDETAIRLSCFFTKRGICGETLKRWKKRSKKLDMAHRLAKRAIGERRESGAVFKKFDGNFIFRTMPLYEKDYVKLEEWRSTMKNQEKEEKTTTFNINIPKFKGNDDDGSGEST